MLKGSEVQSADLLANMRIEMRQGIAKLREEFAELKEEFAELREEFAELREEFAELREEFAELREEFVELRKEIAEMKMAAEEKDARHEAGKEAWEAPNEALEDQLRVQVEDCNQRHEELRRLLRRGIELGNKVKKRVALTEARKIAEIACGRTKGEKESWRSFFATYTLEDWERVGIQTSRVKELLAEGASELNDSIHSIPAVEVVGAIGCMPLGALWSAWEEIFRLAFNRNVSDEIFHKEVDYAQDQQRVLLG